MLTKKDYKAAGEIIRDYAKQEMPQDVIDIAEEAFVQFFLYDNNPLFNEAKFRAYCRK